MGGAERDDPGAARARFEAASVEEGDCQAAACAWLGHWYRQVASDPARAANCYARALELDPDDGVVARNLAGAREEVAEQKRRAAEEAARAARAAAEAAERAARGATGAEQEEAESAAVAASEAAAAAAAAAAAVASSSAAAGGGGGGPQDTPGRRAAYNSRLASTWSASFSVKHNK